MKTRNKGLILSFIGVLILSPDSLLIRLVNLDDFSLIFYRSFFYECLVYLYFKKKYFSEAFQGQIYLFKNRYI